MNKKILNWFLVFIWAGIIFFLSHQPDLKSNFPSEYDFILRKLAHIFEYAVFDFLINKGLESTSIKRKESINFFCFSGYFVCLFR